MSKLDELIMKIALISDIHGNHVALEAVLVDLAQQQPDQLICLGDVAMIGAQPEEVLGTLRTLDAVFIQGNHDAAMLDPETAVQLKIAPTLQSSLLWAIAKLSATDLAFIRQFQKTHTIQLDEHTTMLCFHGSPHANTDLILATTPMEELDALLGESEETIMVGGHSHIQLLRQHHGQLILNPGSVGNSFREPPYSIEKPVLNGWAEYALLEVENGRISVNLLRIPFDTQKLHQITQASDLPIKDWWLQQYQ